MRRIAIAVSMAACMVFLLAAPQVQARAEKLPFTMCELASYTFDGKTWTTDHGAWHARGDYIYLDIVGWFEDGTRFTGHGEAGLNLNINNNSMMGWGKFYYTLVDWRGGVTFTGRFEGASRGAFIVMHGPDGMQFSIRHTSEGAGGTCPSSHPNMYFGEILIPHE